MQVRLEGPFRCLEIAGFEKLSFYFDKKIIGELLQSLFYGC